MSTMLQLMCERPSPVIAADLWFTFQPPVYSDADALCAFVYVFAVARTVHPVLFVLSFLYGSLVQCSCAAATGEVHPSRSGGRFVVSPVSRRTLIQDRTKHIQLIPHLQRPCSKHRLHSTYGSSGNHVVPLTFVVLGPNVD